MIQINLDLVMAQKRISAGRLAELIDLTPANLSILKNNRANSQCSLPRIGMPTRRYIRIYSR